VESPLRRSAPADLVLIETMRWEPCSGFRRLPAHLARLARGAAALGVALDRWPIDRALATVAGEGPQRVRLTVDLGGKVVVTAAVLAPDRPPWVVAIAAARLDSGDPWLRLKTSRRPVYDAARSAMPPGVDELVFLNERGEVCEGSITTVFVDHGQGLLTPPDSCGLLPGVLRAELLARGKAREARLGIADLARGRLFVGNALRGLIPARLAA
jgi:4-amino-4-deoxychorismate lyase